ncbi:uncharacterized protein Dwil_GK27529 [Drosophila willistoni]|uniref:trypsin n=1 Tax=Drosophila willistoni TaxID=7260 RepID=A0A0Q9WSD7_DROWI|nr:vitellin-degrading protease [Drosophila willistoni]KRF99162.1 uncharacterized protein Dwil_GK27529 [Drosophila willistoni]
MLSIKSVVPAFCLLLIISSSELVFAAALDIKQVGIIGGQNASAGQIPYHVCLQMNGFVGGCRCSGSLITETLVLTAAHCLQGEAVTKFKVIAGVIDLNEANNGQTFDAKKFIIHPRFNMETLDYDIALLRLSKPALLNANVQTIAMVAADYKYPEGAEALTSGFGEINPNGDTQSHLKFAHIELWGPKICTFKYFPEITERMICAGDPLGQKGPCRGDSGGPLTINGTLFAVYSFGFGCGIPFYPSVFSYVPRFRQWIDANMSI